MDGVPKESFWSALVYNVIDRVPLVWCIPILVYYFTDGYWNFWACTMFLLLLILMSRCINYILQNVKKSPNRNTGIVLMSRRKGKENWCFVDHVTYGKPFTNFGKRTERSVPSHSLWYGTIGQWWSFTKTLQDTFSLKNKKRNLTFSPLPRCKGVWWTL